MDKYKEDRRNELPLRELHLFAGAGGGILGGELLGHRTVCAVEIEAYPRKVLLQRQRDGILPWFPIWDDITTFDGRPWKGRVDIVSGGFPCQDISAAGKGAGIEGERSGLWGEMARVVHEVSPRFVFVENSPMLTSRGLHRVLGDLAEMGYDARWCVLGADDAGAPHRRKRIWILAHAMQNGFQRERSNWAVTGQAGLCRGKGSHEEQRISWWDHDPADIPNPMQAGLPQERSEQQTAGITGADTQDAMADTGQKYERTGNATGMEAETGERAHRTIYDKSGSEGPRETGPIEPVMGRVANGVAHRVDRLKAIGNGQVPAVAALAFVILSEGLI